MVGNHHTRKVDLLVKYFFAFLTLAAIALYLIVTTGCVSIATHERGKLAAYQMGVEHTVQFMQRYNCDDAKWLVGGELSVQQMRDIMSAKK